MESILGHVWVGPPMTRHFIFLNSVLNLILIIFPFLSTNLLDSSEASFWLQTFYLKVSDYLKLSPLK